MPLYEYVCARCGHRFEVLQRRGGKSRPRCEGCGSKRTERQFSTFAMGGRGSGGGSSGGAACSTCSRASCAGCDG